MITKEELIDLVRDPSPLKGYGEYPNGQPNCLSIVRWAYERCGVKLPSDYLLFLAEFRKIKEDTKPEFLDAIAICLRFPFVDHIGICLGDGKFIHAGRKAGVVINRLDDESLSPRFAGFMRHRKRDEWMRLSQ